MTNNPLGVPHGSVLGTIILTLWIISLIYLRQHTSDDLVINNMNTDHSHIGNKKTNLNVTFKNMMYDNLKETTARSKQVTNWTSLHIRRVYTLNEFSHWTSFNIERVYTLNEFSFLCNKALFKMINISLRHILTILS